MKKLFFGIVFLGVFMSLCAQKKQATANIDSLLNEIPNQKEDTNKVKLLNLLSKRFSRTNADTSLIFANEALDLAKVLNYKTGMADANGCIGVYYFYKAEYASAKEHFLNGLKLAEETQNDYLIANLLNNVALIYKAESEIEKALDYNLRCLEMREKLGDKMGQAASLINIGTIYSGKDDYDKALTYYLKGYDIAKEIKYVPWQANALNGIGNVYYYGVRDYSKALDYFYESVKVQKELGIMRAVARTYGNMADLTFTLSWDSIRTEQAQNFSNGLKSKQFYQEQSIKLLERTVSIFDSIGDLDGLALSCEKLSDAYDRTGNYKKALETFKIYKTSEDSLFSQSKIKKIAALNAQRDLLEKQYAIENEERLKKEADNRRNRLQYLLLGLGVIALIIVMLLANVIRMKDWMARALVFISFISLFELILVIMDPFTDEYSEGIPAIKFAVNTSIALILFPIHHYFQSLAHKHVIRNRKEKNDISEVF